MNPQELILSGNINLNKVMRSISNSISRNRKEVRRKQSRVSHGSFLLVTLAFLQLSLICAKKSIPRSTRPPFISNRILDDETPWNHSPRIDTNGFLTDTYTRIIGEWEKNTNIGGKYGPRSGHTKQLESIPVTVRQVPGDGNCLFHSLSVVLSFVENGRHLNWKGTAENSLDDRMRMYDRSELLRQQAVDMLSEDECTVKGSTQHFLGFPRRRPRLLFLQGNEYLHRRELLQIASSQYDISGEEYCGCMRKDGYWGGGPEIVALCNVLRRPIHVYELIDIKPSPRQNRKTIKYSNKMEPISRQKGHSWWKDNEESNRHRTFPSKPEFRLRRMACFGSPKFDDKEAIHILSTDCRFPDIRPGQQSSTGNHFMAVFPHNISNRRAVHVRSGADDESRWTRVSRRRKDKEKRVEKPQTEKKKQKILWRCRVRRKQTEIEKVDKTGDNDEIKGNTFDHLRVFQRWFQRPALTLVDQWMERVGFY